MILHLHILDTIERQNAGFHSQYYRGLMTEALTACLDIAGWQPGARITSEGLFNREFILDWTPGSLRSQEFWPDKTRLAEFGGYGAALLLFPLLTGLSFDLPAAQPSGCDFYLSRRDGDKERYRLEVSAILTGKESISSRSMGKVHQASRSDDEYRTPAYVLVADFRSLIVSIVRGGPDVLREGADPHA